jgi:TP901 family phage tail tape measure protein
MAINLDVHGNTQPLEAAVQSAVNRIRRQPIKITVDDKGATQPLGNMKRAADEFSKSMEAANARIIAFGASMAIINGMADAFKGMVRNMVEVEKSLADINVVMGLSTQKLDAFSDGLFKVAKETGAAFKVAADAATEYARQGLSVEESLKRTKDALILTRLTGMDSAEAVKSLTAAMNTYGNQIKDTTELVSKFAAVDVKFAVSAEDFADAIARTGAAAKGAGVDIDELIGLVTAAQQQTARGGKVIGNSFKTIFTRIGRTDTLNQLENLGIAVRDVEGKTLGAKKILTDLANTFDSLSEAQKAQIAQTVGGVFQINVLKAVLGDAAKQNGILANATQISAGATNEAIEKNEQLRNTMAAMATETGLAIKQVSAQIGEIMLAPGIEKVLNIVKSGAEGLSGILGDGEGAGNKFANGFLKGLGNVISGPGLVIITAVFGKLFLKAASFAKESLTSLIGVTSEAQKQKAIQTSLVGLFGRSSELSKEMLRTDISRTEKEKIILGLLRMQVSEAKALDAIAKNTASTLYSKGFGANLTPRRGRAYGHIPNFANPEREQAARGGYAAGSIRSMDMPGEGSVIYNSAEKVKTFSGLSQPAIMPPLSSKAGKNYQQAFGAVHGFDPYAAKGFVPNFNKANPRANEKFAHQRQLKNINLSKHAKNLAILFGYGGEGIEKNSYSQSFTSMGPAKYSNVIGHNASANSSLTRYVSKKYPNIRKLYGNNLEKLHSSLYSQNPNVSVSLPSKAIMPISSSEVLSAKKMDELGDQKLKGIVRPPLDSAMKSIAQGIGHSFLVGAGVGIDDKISSIFTENSKGTKANDIIGALAEMGVRGALSAVAEKTGSGEGGQAGAAFDFTGGHAKKISEFFGKGYAFDAVEMKLRGSTAVGKDGGIPKKVINRLMAARGYIPNFANPLSDAIGREREAGVPVSQIRVGTHPALMNKGNPIGLGVTNTRDEPNGLKDVFGAKGYVPNYASSFLSDFSAGRDEYKSAAELQKELNVENKKLLKEQKELNQLKRSGKDVTKRLQGVEKQLTRNLQDQAFASKMAAESTKKMGLAARAGGLTQKAINANQAFSNSAVGRGLSGFGGMGLMMGAPMIAGFLQEGRQGETEQERVQRMQGGSYAAGGALMGAGTGAAMGMMFGPLGTAIGAVGGALYGLANSAKEASAAQEEFAKARTEASIQTGAALAQSLAPSLAKTNFGKGGLVEFSFGGKQRKIDVDNFNKLSAIDPSKSGGFGMRLGDFRSKMLGALNLDMQDILRRGAGSPSAISGILKESGINVSRGQLDAAVYTGKMIKGEDQGDVIQVRERRSSEEQIKRIEDQILAQMGTAARPAAIKAALDQLPQDMKIQTKALAEKGSTAGGRSFKKGDLEYFTPEELKRQIDEGNPAEIAKAYADILKQVEVQRDLNTKQNEGIILQLNLQKAQLKAQKAAAMSQLKIKDKYDKQQINLKALTSLGGEFLTERQKSEIKYREALDRASEQLDLKKDSASADLKNQLLSMKDDTLQNELKKNLLKSEMDKDYGDVDPKSEEYKSKLEFLARTVDLTERLSEMSAEELQTLYEQVKVDDAIKKKIEVIVLAKQNSVDLAEKENELAGERAGKEKVINDLVADRLDAIKKQKEAHQDYIRTMALGDKISNEARKTAKLQRTLSDGPGYKRISERHNIKFREKELDLSYEIAEIRKNQLIEESKEAEKRLELTQRQKGLESGDIELKKGETKEGAQRKLTEELRKSHDRSEQIKATNDAIIDQKTKQLSLEKRIAAEQIKHEASFSGGFTDASDKMLDDASKLDYQLGTITATHFRDGLVSAMDAAINRSEDLGDVLNNIAIGFLQAIQNAFLTSAANTIVGSMGLMSNGGSVRKYSAGGGVPAMVTNGEYVMNRRAVNKYGSSFMHNLNARGEIQGLNAGGEPGSALRANKGSSRWIDSGRAYQSMPMSGFFYSGEAQSVALTEDTDAASAMRAERERKRQEAIRKKMKKKALRNQLLGTALSIGLSMGVNSLFNPGATFVPGGVSAGMEGSVPIAPGGFNNGGRINKYASGGHISGKSGIDQIPAMLSEGEYVIKASSARQIGKPMLDKINAGKFYDGGMVGSEDPGVSKVNSSSATNNFNITLNIDKSGKQSQQDSQDGDDKNKDSRDRMKELTEKIKLQVLGVIVEEQRPGGLLESTRPS